VPDSKIKRIDARTLKAQLHDGGELALLDAREEWPFGKRHLLMASCIPLSRLELVVDDLVPRARDWRRAPRNGCPRSATTTSPGSTAA